MFKKRGVRTELLVNLPMITPVSQEFMETLRKLPQALCPEKYVHEATAVLKIVADVSPLDMPLSDVFNVHVNEQGILTFVFRARWPERGPVVVASTLKSKDDDLTNADLAAEMAAEKCMIFCLNKNAVGEMAWSALPSRHLTVLDKDVFTNMMEVMLARLIASVKPERKTEHVAARGDQRWVVKSADAHASLLMEAFREYIEAQNAA